MTRAAVEAILDQEAERALGARELRRLLHLEAYRIETIKQVLFEKAIAGENAAAAIYIKASERLSSMIGINSPQGHSSRSAPPSSRPSSRATRSGYSRPLGD
jgi:hypothetical protein